MAVLKPRYKAIVLTALNTGMRLGEITNLRWDQIDFRARIIRLEKTKINETRVIPINEELSKVLEERRKYRFRSKILVFSDDGKPVSGVSKWFRRAANRAGLKDFRFHDLRHTFASYLVMKGADIRTVQALLGHKDIKMTMRYSHLSDAHMKETVKKLNGLWPEKKSSNEIIADWLQLAFLAYKTN